MINNLAETNVCCGEILCNRLCMSKNKWADE